MFKNKKLSLSSKIGFVATGTVLASPAFAVTAENVGSITTPLLASAALAVGGGYAVMAFTKANGVGMSLLSKFISKGARS